MGEILVPIAEYKKLIQTELRYKQIQDALYQFTDGKYSTWAHKFEPYLNIETIDFFDAYKVIDPEFYEVISEDKYLIAKKKWESECKKEDEENVSD